jgi:16S rRNA (guanine527-N7)-methyltransferase
MSRHLLESMMILKHIERDATRLVDIGTGGGLPGIPLHIARPNLRVSLIESARMKALFLNEVVRSMSLDRVEVVRDRAESFSGYRWGTFDVATSRAVASLDRVWELAEPLLKPQGTLISLKGPGEAEGELGSLGIEFSEHLIQMEDRILAVVVVRKA